MLYKKGNEYKYFVLEYDIRVGNHFHYYRYNRFAERIDLDTNKPTYSSAGQMIWLLPVERKIFISQEDIRKARLIGDFSFLNS